ncbi:MAG: LuxR C-terminal-related transcriptional regulator [Oscillospiraceae bacterium]|nr:LuxR C-terminal-related transcriptional regulator [Oscillospiraceae bacterium]
MIKPLITVPYELRETFQRGLTHYKVIFLSAGTGWGKTSVVDKLLEKQNITYISLRKKPLPGFFSKERLIVLDDFQELPPQTEQQFQEILRKSPRGQNFILLSRGPLPGYLSFYEATGALLQLGTEQLALDMDCLVRLAQAHKLSLSTHDFRRLRDETGGFPVAINFLLLMLSAGQPFQQSVIDAMSRKMGAYIDETTLRLLDPKARKLLAELSLFDQFDQALAEMLTQDRTVLGTMDSLWQINGLIQPHGDTWRIADQKFLRPYLRQKVLAGYPTEQILAIHLAGGRWYALRQDLRNALYHYQQAGSRKDVIDVLSQNARLHPGVGAYYEMRDYYNTLTEEEIRDSPDMICAMSLLRSMTFDPEDSEKWYELLKEYIRHMDRQDSEFKRVRGLQSYLEICLPHRGTTGLIQKIPSVYKLLKAKSLMLPEMSVTSNLPSLLRGGKDFSEWVSMDIKQYNTILGTVEMVLGRYGVGLGEIALTESLLEKGEDVSGRFLTLTALQEELRAKGTPEMEFVLIALLIRALLAAGNMGKAQSLLAQFRAETAERSITRLLPNIDAMQCRMSLLDDSIFSSIWFSEQAPNEGVFYAMERYRYLTKVRCYIKCREYHSALLLLGRMLDYTQRYARPLDMLETLVLISICRYRMENGDWREHFARALKLGAKYGYVAVFTREGAALLPLLEQYHHEAVKPGYWERILSGTVVQAGYYGQYLQQPDDLLSRLTQAETMILRLICQDKSNKDICTLLHIKLPTVKTHVRNLFKKLKVRSRAEAQKAAKRLGLI